MKVVLFFLGNFINVDFEIQNGLFGIVALLPKTFDREKINLITFINIYQVILYLKTNIQENKYFSRKIPVLVHKWIKHFSGLFIFLLNKNLILEENKIRLNELNFFFF